MSDGWAPLSLTFQLQENGDPDGELAYFTQRFGHYVGVLIGAKFMGAPRPISKIWLDPRVKMGHVRFLAQSEAKKTRRA